MDARLNGPAGPVFFTTSILTLGRVPDNQVPVNDPKASSHHAEIRQLAYGHSIIDLGSTNGTFVNEQRLEPHNPRILNDGDTIRIGDTRYTYSAGSPAEMPSTVYAPPGANPVDDSYLPTVAAPPPVFDNYTPRQVPPPVPPVPSGPQNYPGPVPPPPMPGYVPPILPTALQPQPPKRNLKWLWITLSIVGGLLLLLCVGCSFVVFIVNASTPTKTLDTFCADLNNRQYHDAYLQLSASAQSSESEAVFTRTFSNVNSCAHGSASDDGSRGSANLILTNRFNLALNLTVNLIKDSNSKWKINDLRRPA